MNYESMWNEMKDTYHKRLLKLESEGKKNSTAWINAKRIADVMSHFEHKQEEQEMNRNSSIPFHHGLHDRLDFIWNNAQPCKCGNDDKWAQESNGDIRCNRCRVWVVEKGESHRSMK